MARPIKTGLDYFSFDVDFYDNLKIRKIIRACGPSSGSILTCLLCNIYRNKGYYMLWDEDMPFEMAEKVGISEGAVLEVVKKSLQVGLFCQEMFDKFQILTSAEIQKRYRAATAKRHEVVIDGIYRVIDAGNSINVVDNTQSKVKESKVKESKGERAPPVGNDPIVFFDAEKLILENQIQFERICISAKNKNLEEVKISLRKFHLFLEEKDRYPLTLKQILAGFEKWLMNEKNYSNATHQRTPQQSSGGKSAGAERLLASLKDELDSFKPGPG